MQAAVKVERPVTRPNSFIFTLYGDLVHRHSSDGSLWIGGLVRLMAAFGLSEAAVRQAVSRMSRQGWLVARRRGNRAYYAVTDRGRRRIEGLSPRIYAPTGAWDGRWRMLTYSVAESSRAGRDRLRKDLAVLGWAALSASTWISPSDGFEQVREAAQSADVFSNIDLFTAQYAGPLSDGALLARCWDLARIAATYREFIARYTEPLGREHARGGLDDRDAFVERLWLLHDYRKFTYVDPGLPKALLPNDWPGTQAAALFRAYYDALEEKSLRYFQRASSE